MPPHRPCPALMPRTNADNAAGPNNPVGVYCRPGKPRGSIHLANRDAPRLTWLVKPGFPCLRNPWSAQK